MNPVEVQILNEAPEVTLLKLYGDIGLEQIPQISTLVDEYYAKGALHWAVDLSNVNFLSSPAVGAIMGLRSRVVSRLGSISLFAASPRLSEKLKLMGVNFVIPSFRNLEAYLAHFRWEYKGESRELNLILPAKSAVVPPTRQLVVGLLRSKGYGQKDAFIMESIVDELANNAIEHGKPVDGVFELKMKIDKSKISLTVINRCEELSEEAQKALIEKYEHPKVNQNSVRGRGIVLVKKLSTKMTYRVEPQRVEVNIVRIREGK
jgi:anti-anti-sigma factor